MDGCLAGYVGVWPTHVNSNCKLLPLGGKEERIVLDLESEIMRGLGSIPNGGNILSLDFFHVVKPLMPILSLLPISSNL